MLLYIYVLFLLLLLDLLKKHSRGVGFGPVWVGRPWLKVAQARQVFLVLPSGWCDSRCNMMFHFFFCTECWFRWFSLTNCHPSPICVVFECFNIRFFPDPILVVDPFLQNYEAPKPEEKKTEEIDMASTPCPKSKAATVKHAWELFEIFFCASSRCNGQASCVSSIVFYFQWLRW